MVQSQKKALVRHLIGCLPKDLQDSIKMDAIRFRSLQLSAPVPLDSGVRQNGSSSSTAAKADGESSNDEAEERANNHAKKRARRWQLREEGLDDAEAAKIAAAQEKQKYLTAAQKRKVAYIKGEVHEKAKSCNAYVVWTAKGRPSAAATGEASSASDLAKAIIEHANNSVFAEHTLRVDAAAHANKGKLAAAATSSSGKVAPSSTAEAIEAAVKAKKAAAEAQKLLQEEEKRTLYIGGLDFEETEENVRALCEKLMREERGEPSSSSSSSSSHATAQSGGSRPCWVERVRVVKDAETGLGKGFAYVLFKDRECVDEMLALDTLRVRLSKRKVRLERCNTTRAAAAAKAKLKAEEKAAAKSEKQAARESALKAKGKELQRASRALQSTAASARPDIGEELKDLPKADRKALKLSDEDRQARRLAKKQVSREKLKLEKAKEVLDKKLKATNKGGKADSKRARTDSAPKKTRIRSAKAASKKNSKKPEAT